MDTPDIKLLLFQFYVHSCHLQNSRRKCSEHCLHFRGRSEYCGFPLVQDAMQKRVSLVWLSVFVGWSSFKESWTQKARTQLVLMQWLAVEISILLGRTLRINRKTTPIGQSKKQKQLRHPPDHQKGRQTERIWLLVGNGTGTSRQIFCQQFLSVATIYFSWFDTWKSKNYTTYR